MKINNPLYSDIQIDVGQIPEYLLSLAEPIDIPIEVEQEINLLDGNTVPEDTDNPLDNDRLRAVETMLLSNIPETEYLIIAPGEGRQPMSILLDEKCEELAHPFLFPTGKFGYTVERDVKLSPVKYFNERLLNYKQKFASDCDYIFMHSLLCYSLILTAKLIKRFVLTN